MAATPRRFTKGDLVALKKSHTSTMANGGGRSTRESTELVRVNSASRDGSQVTSYETPTGTTMKVRAGEGTFLTVPGEGNEHVWEQYKALTGDERFHLGRQQNDMAKWVLDQRNDLPAPGPSEASVKAAETTAPRTGDQIRADLAELESRPVLKTGAVRDQMRAEKAALMDELKQAEPLKDVSPKGQSLAERLSSNKSVIEPVAKPTTPAEDIVAQARTTRPTGRTVIPQGGFNEQTGRFDLPNSNHRVVEIGPSNHEIVENRVETPYLDPATGEPRTDLAPKVETQYRLRGKNGKMMSSAYDTLEEAQAASARQRPIKPIVEKPTSAGQAIIDQANGTYVPELPFEQTVPTSKAAIELNQRIVSELDKAGTPPWEGPIAAPAPTPPPADSPIIEPMASKQARKVAARAAKDAAESVNGNGASSTAADIAAGHVSANPYVAEDSPLVKQAAQALLGNAPGAGMGSPGYEGMPGLRPAVPQPVAPPSTHPITSQYSMGAQSAGTNVPPATEPNWNFGGVPKGMEVQPYLPGTGYGMGSQPLGANTRIPNEPNFEFGTPGANEGVTPGMEIVPHVPASTGGGTSGGTPPIEEEVGGAGRIAGLLGKIPGLKSTMGMGELPAVEGLGGTALGFGVPIAGGYAANFLGNEAQHLLGGKGGDKKDQNAGDLVAKIIKWGGTGAAMGAPVEGVGAVPGALIGGAIGVGDWALHKLGIMGSDKNSDMTPEQKLMALSTKLHLGSDLSDPIMEKYRIQMAAADGQDNQDELEKAAQADALTGLQQAAIDAIGNQQTEKDKAQRLQEAAVLQAQLGGMLQPYADQVNRSSVLAANLYNQFADRMTDPVIKKAIQAQAGQALQSGNKVALGLMTQNLVQPEYLLWQQQQAQQRQAAQQLVQQAMASIGQQAGG